MLGTAMIALLSLGSSVDRSAADKAHETASDTALGGATAVRRTPALRSFTVAAVGDVLTENAVLNAGSKFAQGSGQRYVFGPLFEPVRPIISAAHLAICHMEIPIGRPAERPGVYGRSPFGGNLLLAPYEIAAGLADAGFDRCSTASNHSYDLGNVGIDSTLEAFDATGISHEGTARHPDEAITDLVMVNGVKLAHLSYTRMSNTVRPRDAWRMNFASSAQQVIDATRAARRAGAEVVIVSVHISFELQHSPIARDRQFVEELTASGMVDLVIEHGPHVIQPIEQVNGTWVYWSLGNFASGMGMPGATRYGPPTLDELMAWVRFEETTVGTFSVTPSSVLMCEEIFGRVVYPAKAALVDPSVTPELRRQLQACVDRSLRFVPNAE